MKVFPLIKLAKKLKDALILVILASFGFPLIKLAKKLKEDRLFEHSNYGNSRFPLIKLAKKLKEQSITGSPRASGARFH